jgi:type IV pilus assembly protein PilY1
MVTLGLLLSITSSPPLLADDVQIYITPPPNPVPPNVLFVLDESGSMNGTPRTQLITAMQNIINDATMANVNAALLGYTTFSWGGAPRLTAHSGNFMMIGANQATFLTQINNLQALSGTPTVRALESAVNWFDPNPTFNFTDSTNTTMATPITGAPVNNWCKPNHIVLLSDGSPNSNALPPSANNGINTFRGAACTADALSFNQGGNCAREIAAWALATDLQPGNSWTGTQNITTHTIGFNTNAQTQAFLTSISNAGGGNFYPAANSTQITAAFQAILTTAQQSIPYAYTAPVIPFNQSNAAVSGNRIYVPMFVPTGTSAWGGNLKSYTITTDPITSKIILRDANNNPIIDSNYAFISSQDHWSSTLDGGDPLANGAAAQMGASNVSRKLYTNLNNTLPLSNAANLVKTTNITNADMGVAANATRIDLINWITWNWTAPTPAVGQTAAPSHEGTMGAPIHTHPSVVDYNGNKVIYLPTSEGVLEAIDATTGKELWAFMPKDLLPNILALKTNASATVPGYGLDGPLTIYKIGPTNNPKTMAIVGMRRGGKSYYLLDITDRLNPKFITQITDPAPSTAGDSFDGLGQTWSKAIHSRIFIGNAVKDVLVFGGGYDTDQDNATTRVNDNEGNAIFIVDAANGSLLLKLSNSTTGISGMNNAIPANVIPFDMNRNGVVDRIYAADVGGRIIRIDVPESTSGTLTGGVIADINAAPASAFRRFFNTPEIGYYNRNGVQYLAIMIGTGNQPTPLDTSVKDRFYMIKDPNVWTPPSSYVVVKENSLYDTSANLIQDGNNTQQTAASNSLAAANGWYLDFGSSEKSYSEAVLYNYAVLFTTYSATINNNQSVCQTQGATGVSRFYAVNMTNGAAIFPKLGGNDTLLDINDRSMVLSMNGIPPASNLVFPEGDNGMLGTKVKAMVGLEEVQEWPNQLIPIWWEESINN